MNIVKYSERVHIARTHELASTYPPYERVPNILRYSFNNLFIIIPSNKQWRDFKCLFLAMASQVHINSLNLGLNFKPWFENFKPGFENFKPGF